MIRIQAGEPIEAHLTSGDELVLAAGIHVASLMPESSVVIRGEEGAVLEGAGARCVHVDVDGVEVTLVNLTLRKGYGEAGAGVCLTGWSTLTLRSCHLDENIASEGGGGGAYANRGKLVVEDCTFTHNRARHGSDLVATGVAEVTLKGGHFAGDVAVREGAVVSLERVVLDGTLDIRGTTTRAPTVRLRESSAAGGVLNDANLPGTVSES